MSGHTPGPWLLETADGRIPAIREFKQPHGEASIYRATIRTAKREHVCVLDFGYGKKDVDAANANVLAAAPHLYSACEQILHWFDVDSSEFSRDMAVAACRAALAKADGRG